MNTDFMKGGVVPILTVIDAEEKIDEAKMRAHVDYVIEGGVSGVLRVVGDTMRPLYFLIFTSVPNILLDLVFVLGLHTGIEGVAWATIGGIGPEQI